MHIITSGNAFIDIDAYGSAVALAELLRLQGEEAIAAGTTPLNASVPQSLRTLDTQFETNYKPSADDVFTIVDLSIPGYFDFKAPVDKVVGVIDHHLGWEDFWEEKLGSKSRIEFVGAACTLVYEEWQKAGMLERMSQNSARLLACGILDNTLNLKANITTERDKLAYATLAEHANLPDNWPEQYFSECQDYILGNTEEALSNDAKFEQYPSLPDKTYVGQLALWDAKEFIHSNKNIIQSLLASKNLPWYMNLIDIKTGRSIFFCENPSIKDWLEQTLDVTFKEDLATADRMWLRKEIMKQAIGQPAKKHSKR